VKLLRFAAWAELSLVLVVLALERAVGERAWPVVALTYAPQIVFAIPIVVLAPLLYLHARRLLWTQSVALLIVVFPLMGLRLGFSRSPQDASHVVRLMTYNVWWGWRGEDSVMDEVEAAHPDVVLMQAASDHLEAALRQRYPSWTVARHHQFLMGTRLRMLDARAPDYNNIAHAFYTVETAGGPMDLLSLHPDSPREPINRLRGRETHHNAPDNTAVEAFARNSDVRRRQLEAAMAEAARATHPLIVAGDTNLPTSTWLYRLSIGAYRDAFDDVGFGFGYTFPTQHRLEWMRIDRVAAGPGVRFLRVARGGRAGSDHRPLIVDLELAQP